MMAKKESAEQKLLQMIEASSGGASAKAAPAKKQGKKNKIKMSSVSLLSLTSNILIVLLIISVIFLFREISLGSKTHKEQLIFSVDNFEKSTFDLQSILPNLQDIKYYQSALSKRNIFKPYEEPTRVANVEPTEETEGLEITRMINALKLVGISWMDRVDTASVMIEDVDKKVTYFLQKGEKLNDIIVKTIYADSALLGYKDEEIIIKYEKSER